MIFFKKSLWVPSGYLLGPQYAPWHDDWYIGWAVLHVAHMVHKASAPYYLISYHDSTLKIVAYP